jgi:uncharacterized protein (DUF433 family)
LAGPVARPQRLLELTCDAVPASSGVSWYPSLMDALSRITHDPQVMGGRPCVRGLRMTVGTIVGLLAAGKTADDILTAYPYLEPDDIRAALAYAAWRAEEVEVPLPQ